MKSQSAIPSPLLSQLDSRDVALWLSDESGGQDTDPKRLAALLRLPWQLVLSEIGDPALIAELEISEEIENLLVRRRGLVHIVDEDPSSIVLPPRHLAIHLLNGRNGGKRSRGMAALTRRFTMFADLRKRSIKQLVIVVQGDFVIPEDFVSLWEDGFRTVVTFVSSDPKAESIINQWRQSASASLIDLIRLTPLEFAEELSSGFVRGRDGQVIVRMRNQKGQTVLVDASTVDDPERPLLSLYELIGNEALTPLLPSDLTAAEVDGFFTDPGTSWRTYAAGMAWDRHPEAWQALRSQLRQLDRRGSEANRIFYIPAESGAGATTFLRDLAFKVADEGYPALVARRGQLPASAVETVNFLTRLISAGGGAGADGATLYETPCVLIFDHEHWAGRETELASFAGEIERSGRRVCFLIATGPYVGLGLLAERRFVQLVHLTHEMTASHSMSLGRHLNRFLSPHGTSRSEHEWQSFFRSSSLQTGPGVAAFWIVLSFWLQRQIDIGETVQSRVYNQFRDANLSPELRRAVLRIAAFSTVRTPLPDALLPKSADWPTAERLSDCRKDLGALGLIRVSSEHERAWALAHDLLGRYIITSLFYDFKARDQLGFGAAANPEQMRFLLLKEISQLEVLQRNDLRELAEAFAVSIFKIDPDHGYGTLSPFWRDVLSALDEMPRTIRTTSRTFLHHSAISRRRIAADAFSFPISSAERVDLLRTAVSDLEAALRLPAEQGEETDISLFNSLAHACHDLADAEEAAGSSELVISAARIAAHEATRKAFALNPDNSFVVETYARNLLSQVRSDSAAPVAIALEVLNLVYAQMASPASDTRRNALGRLAEQAFGLLLEHVRYSGGGQDTSSETGAMAAALAELSYGVEDLRGKELREYPLQNRLAAAKSLATPVLAGNVQAVKLRYLLSTIDDPLNFEMQLELLQALDGSGPAFTPQLRLELATLLFQKDRFHEGDQLFRQLRGLWRKGEHYVEVPARVHWLLDASKSQRRQVRATVSMSTEGRPVARVKDFQGIEVPFRPTEFSTRPGTTFSAYVTFGHNGPLLRPLTAA